MTTDLKTWVLVPVRKEWDAIYVTTAQMEGISRAWKNNVMAELRDPATGNLKEVLYRTDWRPRPIKVDPNEIKERAGKRWICNYGSRHPMHVGIKTDEAGQKYWTADCECPQKFGYTADQFIDWCDKKYGGVAYPHHVKAHMQDEFLRIQSIAPKETYV